MALLDKNTDYVVNISEIPIQDHFTTQAELEEIPLENEQNIKQKQLQEQNNCVRKVLEGIFTGFAGFWLIVLTTGWTR